MLSPRYSPHSPNFSHISDVPHISAIEFSCDGREEGDHPFDENTCNSAFVKCTSDKRAYKIVCPFDLAFNPSMKVCDFAYNVPYCANTEPQALASTLGNKGGL